MLKAIKESEAMKELTDATQKLLLQMLVTKRDELGERVHASVADLEQVSREVEELCLKVYGEHHVQPVASACVHCGKMDDSLGDAAEEEV